MAITLNHTIVHVPDKQVSAPFLAEVLGLPAPKPYATFLVVELDNGVSLDFLDAHGQIQPQHYAFLVTEDEFDEIFARLQARGLDYWADPGQRRRGEINHHDGGRGVYWQEPAGHLLEIITRPYGSSG